MENKLNISIKEIQIPSLTRRISFTDAGKIMYQVRYSVGIFFSQPKAFTSGFGETGSTRLFRSGFAKCSVFHLLNESRFFWLIAFLSIVLHTMLRTQPAKATLRAARRRQSSCPQKIQKFSSTSSAAAISPYQNSPQSPSSKSSKDVIKRGQSTAAATAP